jgi:transcriptional regulator with XRE-family HTH domain
MNKMYLAKKAKELYQIEHLNADEIAKRLGISRRTVFNWMKQFDFKKLPPQPLQLWELQDAASAMLKSLDKNPEYYNKSTINEMFKFFDFVLDEETKAKKQQKENPMPKGLTPERVREIQQNILGMNV